MHLVLKIFNKAKKIPSIVFRKLLHRIYRFDSWHLSIISDRPYAMGVISYCNSKSEKNSIVEIGAGLCDMLSNIQCRHKIALDQDLRVLKAAGILNFIRFQFSIRTKVFDFPSNHLSGFYDYILMVNWIHHVPPEILRSGITKMFDSNLNKFGTIIIDTVDDSAYKFNHDIEFITSDIKAKIFLIGTYERERRVWAIIKN